MDKLCNILGDAELSEYIAWNQARFPLVRRNPFVFSITASRIAVTRTPLLPLPPS